MKRKNFAIVVVIITIIYCIIGALLFLDIQQLQAPETTIHLEFIELTSDEAIWETMIEVTNPNAFELTTRDFEVQLLSETQDEIAQVSIDGGAIPSGKTRTFTATVHMQFDTETIGDLTAKISSRLGITFLGFIKKTIPVDVTVITSVDQIVQELVPPVLSFNVDLSELTEDGVIISGFIDVYNPNTFDLFIENISVEIETETGDSVGSLTVSGGLVEAGQSGTLEGEGIVLIEALNAKQLLVHMQGAAGANIAGYTKSILVEADATIMLPNVQDLLSIDEPTDLIIRSDYRVSRRGFDIDVTLEIRNPNEIDLRAEDMVVRTYRVDDDTKQLIGEGSIESGIIEAGTTGYLEGQMNLSYSTIFFSNGHIGLPDYLLLEVNGNVSIPRLNYSLWVGISGYQDIHPFR